MKVDIVRPPKPATYVNVQMTLDDARALAALSVKFADCCRVELDCESVFRRLQQALVTANVHGFSYD